MVVLVESGFMLSGQVLAGVVFQVALALLEVTAALFFAKDKELRGTIERYHQHVLDSKKLLTMIDVAETVQNESERDIVKSQIPRECQCNRGTGCGKTARPGLWRGRPVTGVPTPDRRLLSRNLSITMTTTTAI
jgi:hypothetical protein